MKWILEKDTFREGLDDLTEAIKKQGMDVEIVTYIPFDNNLKLIKAIKDPEFIFYGSLNLAEIMVEEYPDNVYYGPEEYNCSTYYNYFGEYHVNKDYIMLPFGELERRCGFLMSTIGINGTVFVRPDTGTKSFTGQTATYQTWLDDIKLMGTYDVPDNELVLVSKPRTIIKEWRFIVVEDELITGSLYVPRHEEVSIDSYAGKFARKVLDDVSWRPSNIWVLDICETVDNRLHVLEIGCFSSAGQYACNKDLIVEQVSKTHRKVFSK